MNTVLKYVLLCMTLSLNMAQAAQSAGNEKIKPTEKFAKNYEGLVNVIEKKFKIGKSEADQRVKLALKELYGDNVSVVQNKLAIIQDRVEAASSIEDMVTIGNQFSDTIEKVPFLFQYFYVKQQELRFDYIYRTCPSNVENIALSGFDTSIKIFTQARTAQFNQYVWPYVSNPVFQKIFNSAEVQNL